MSEHDSNRDSEFPSDIEDKLDLLLAEVAALRAHQLRQQELIDEMMPIGRQAMTVLAERLEGLESRGWFGFGRGTVRIAEKVVAAYGEDDLDALGDNVVRILDTVREFTQPALLDIAGEASRAVHDRQQPKTLLGMLRATQDRDVRRGLGVAIEVLRRVGRGTRRAARVGLKARPALPRPVRTPTRRDADSPVRETPARVGSVIETLVVEGVTLDEQGFVADPASWSRETAQRVAAALDIALDERHWKVIDFARADFAENGKSPNIRRIARGSGVSTREIYEAFGRSPGITAARIAGVPKPVGCI